MKIPHLNKEVESGEIFELGNRFYSWHITKEHGLLFYEYDKGGIPLCKTFYVTITEEELHLRDFCTHMPVSDKFIELLGKAMDGKAKHEEE